MKRHPHILSVQDDIEEAFVVKQILQHLATKHGINFHEVAFKKSDVQRVDDIKRYCACREIRVCKLLCHFQR